MVDGGPARVGAVVLAAGASSRMGTPKQVLEFRGESLLGRAVRAALDAGCRPVVVVTGAHAGRSREELRGLDVLEVENARWQSGMGSSVRAGVGALLGADAEVGAAVVLVCDQPFVTTGVVAALVDAHWSTKSPVVASHYGDSFGVPALFARALFGELAGLEGRGGAKRIIEAHAPEAHFIRFPEGEIDVDTPDDFARLTSADGR